MSPLAKAMLVVFLAAWCALLGACSQTNDQGHNDPRLRQTTAEELEAAREKVEREAALYEDALAAAPVYRSEIRDLLIQHPERYRASGRDGLSGLWHEAGRSQSFRCIHPPKSIDRAKRDGWQLVQCDRRSAYFLRGPVDPARGYGNKRLAPTVEEAFEVLKISYGSASPLVWKGAPPRRSPAIRAALPDIYERPTKADRAQTGIASGAGDEVRVAYYDFKRRKETSVYDEARQTVVTLIFKEGEETAASGAKGTSLVENAVIWAQSPLTDYAAMSELLSVAQGYVGGIE